MLLSEGGDEERKGVRRGGAFPEQKRKRESEGEMTRSFESCTLRGPHQQQSVFKTEFWHPAYLLSNSGTPSARRESVWKELENISWWFSGPGSTSSSFPHQNRDLTDTIYSRDSWENNHSWKKLNHTPIKIAFNQCWCLMKSPLKGSTKINSHCIPVHYSLCAHFSAHIHT